MAFQSLGKPYTHGAGILLTGNTAMFPETGAYTMMCWAKFPTDYPDAKLSMLWGETAVWVAAQRSVQFYVTPIHAGSGGIAICYCRFYGDQGLAQINSNQAIAHNDNTWRHYALTRPVNGTGNIVYYVNGVSVATVARINNNNISYGSYLANATGISPYYNTGNEYFYGSIAESIIIKGVEYSADQVKSAMVRRYLPNSNTVIYYPLDEGADNLAPGGLDAADLSPQANHGTIHLHGSGTSTWDDGPPIGWRRGS